VSRDPNRAPESSGRPHEHQDAWERPERAPDGVSLVRLATTVIRHRRAFVLLPLVAVSVFVLAPFLLRPPFTAVAAFTPQGASSVSQLSGLAAQFGFELPQAGDGESPAFYAQLLASRELLRRVALSEYTTRGGPGSRAVELAEVFGVEGDTEAVRLERTVNEIVDRLHVRTDLETGIVRYTISTPWPEISLQIAERILEGVNTFNLERRRSQASAEREFVAQQLEDAQADLIAAEDSLQAFLEANRRYENSPELRFAHDRIQRRVDLRQQVFAALARSYEEARIGEVRNTPVITIVEPPREPPTRDPTRLPLRIAVGLVLGTAAAALWALAREVIARTRIEEPDEYRQLEALKGQLAHEWGGIWRRMTRRIRRPDTVALMALLLSCAAPSLSARAPTTGHGYSGITFIAGSR
jgi:uncharacterized protein involved in exopolysaccharide biosynthesis